MSQQSPYEQLGVTEESSFEEIQTARDRLVAEHQGNGAQLEAIETAYDAVLMDRLRLRQEGKIKVPDRIRFPEKLVQPPPAPALKAPSKAPSWLQHLLDTPSVADIWIPAAIAVSLSGLVIFSPPTVLQLALVIGVGACFYFLYRKERKLGRSVLLTLLTLCLGIGLGGFLGSVLVTQLPTLTLAPDTVGVVFTFLLFWLVSSFLR